MRMERDDAMTAISMGIVGDLHAHWDAVDVEQFDDTVYDLLYFPGDLGNGSRESSLRMAREMSRLRKPALVMPGNNDVGDIAALAAELSYRKGLSWLAAARPHGMGGAGHMHLRTKQGAGRPWGGRAQRDPVRQCGPRTAHLRRRRQRAPAPCRAAHRRVRGGG